MYICASSHSLKQAVSLILYFLTHPRPLTAQESNFKHGNVLSFDIPVLTHHHFLKSHQQTSLQLTESFSDPQPAIHWRRKNPTT